MLISYFLQTHTVFLIYVLPQAAPLHGDGALPRTTVSAGLPQATDRTRSSPGNRELSVLEAPFNPELSGALPSYNNLPCSVETPQYLKLRVDFDPFL